MTLLISNDDGVNAPGIQVLAKHLSAEFELKVVAPDRDHSGASGSLTLSRPLKVTETESGFYCVDGTPTDSVHLGISSLFDHNIERVVSGINSHENLGDDVLYSGTVAAAIEGRFLDRAPIAVSLANRGLFHYDTAARVVLKILKHEMLDALPRGTILNINVPDLPYDELKGMKVTRLGHRAKGLPPERVADPRGRERYWISLAGEGNDAGEDTDFHAVAQGYVSVTPIQVDMTRYTVIEELKAWIED